MLIILSSSVFAQDNPSSAYDEPTDFQVGDALLLNEPSNEGSYRSIYYTYDAAKNIRPDLKPYSTEKIYLSSQFYKAPFTVVEINGKEATLAYGIMKNFAIMDLELGIRSGEIGNKQNMAPIWLVDEINKDDLVQLKKASGDGLFKSVYFTPKFTKKTLKIKSSERTYLSEKYEGDILKIAKRWDEIALVGNDSAKEIAFIDLKMAIENEELEIRENHFLTKSAFELDTVNTRKSFQLSDSALYALEVDTIPKVTLLDKWGIGIYLAPLVETSTKSSSSVNYGGAIGVIIRNKWQVGAFIQKYGGSFAENLIFPNSFNLDYTYTGFFGAYPLLQKGNLTLLAETKVGVGEAAWSTEETTEVLDSDNFFVFNPRLGLDYKLNRIGILNLSIGYRLVQGLEMTELSSAELNSFNLSAMLKIGWFNKSKDE